MVSMGERQRGVRVTLRGDRVLLLRESRGEDQGTAAYGIGISQSHLSRIEGGHVGSVSAEIAQKIMDYYGTSLDFMTGLGDRTAGYAAAGAALTDDEIEALHLYREIRDEAFRAAARSSLRQFLELDRRKRPGD